MQNCFTVDVEDYFHVSAFSDRIRRQDWDQFECRVERNTRAVLRTLERFGVRGTFFVLGWVATRYPHLVREIQRSGHEIGCHSYWHRLVYEMTPQEFRDDLRQARDVLEQTTGAAVTAYRAPSFSITSRSLWALEMLAAEGFRYDASIYPVHHDVYGLPGSPPYPHRIRTAAGDLWEFPASVHRVFGCNLPISGGGYFRLYPLRFSLHCLRQINEQGQPFMFYVHPWEFDPEQPRQPCGWKSRFRHYVNLAENQAKLERLLAKFRFGAVGDLLSQQLAANGDVPLKILRPELEPESPASANAGSAPRLRFAQLFKRRRRHNSGAAPRLRLAAAEHELEQGVTKPR